MSEKAVMRSTGFDCAGCHSDTSWAKFSAINGEIYCPECVVSNNYHLMITQAQLDGIVTPAIRADRKKLAEHKPKLPSRIEEYNYKEGFKAGHEYAIDQFQSFIKSAPIGDGEK